MSWPGYSRAPTSEACEVLDIGCGLGAVDELLITQYGASSVVGIDIDPALLQCLQARVKRAGLVGRIRGVKVEPGGLPFADASFDVVFSKDSLVQIPENRPCLRIFCESCARGCRFIASDWLRGGTGAYSSEMMEYFRLEGIAYNMVTLEESAAALRNAGFVGVTFATATPGTWHWPNANSRRWRVRSGPRSLTGLEWHGPSISSPTGASCCSLCWPVVNFGRAI